MPVFGHDILNMEPWVDGLVYAPRFGRVAGLGLDSNLLLYADGQPTLRGEAIIPSYIDDEEYDWHVFVDGVRETVQQDADLFLLPWTPAGTWLKMVNILGTLRDPAQDILDGTAFFYAYPVGDNVILSWSDSPDEDDFDAYLIYYDEGDGLGADTLLATIEQKELRSYVVSDLSTGTYEFKILYRDIAGNIGNGVGGDNGETATATITAAPATITEITHSLDDIGTGESRAQTFSFTETGGSGTMGYLWAVNQFPFFDELPFADTRWAYCRRRYPGATTLTLQVFAGTWRVAVMAVNGYGGIANIATLDFQYIDDGAGGLTYIAGAPPDTIYDIRAESIIAGDIRVTCTADVPETGGVAFYRDDTEFDTVAYQADGEYSVDDDGSALPGGSLTEGQTYTYKVRPYSQSGAYGEYSHEVTAISDGTPPSGDQVISAAVTS